MLIHNAGFKTMIITMDKSLSLDEMFQGINEDLAANHDGVNVTYLVQSVCEDVDGDTRFRLIVMYPGYICDTPEGFKQAI